MKQPEKDTKVMETVLVVEDSRAMQRTLQRLLEADSLQVQIASDGIAGLETFRKQPPSAVLLDLKLPGLSGKELCREFKTIAASVPIVVLSANAEVEDKVLLLELGADDYVTKPFSPRELVTLTAQEFKLLKFFAGSPGRVLTRDELLNEVWGYQNYPSTRTVDNHILRLRQKLEPHSANPRFFLTIHGAGYKFIPGNGGANGKS